jgi:archaellum component FlaC
MEEENAKVLNEIFNKLQDMDKRLEKLEKNISYIKNSSDNMNDHISFIEHVYDSIKSPFYYIMNKIKPIEQIPTKEIKQLLYS